MEIEPSEVNVTNGDKLKYEEVVRDVKLNMQRIHIITYLHVLSIV